VSRWLAAVTRGAGSSDRTTQHALREQRLEHIRDAVEQFTFDLGLLIAGHDVEDRSRDHALLLQLQRELQPFLDAGDAMRPDFGAFGDLRIEGELLEPTEPVLATLEFDDRCMRETASGHVVPARGRRLRITLHVAIDPVHVLDCAISEVGARRA
jgi:hypothetical protein